MVKRSVTSSKNNLLKKEKKSLRYFMRCVTLESKLKQAKKQLIQHAVGIFVYQQASIIDEVCSEEFDEELFNKKMRRKYQDADLKELKVNDLHYKHWQNTIHFMRFPNTNVIGLRQLFRGKSKRQECHEFCLSMKIACNLFGIEIKLDMDLLPKMPMDKKLIVESLKEITFLQKSQIKHIVLLMQVYGFST